MSSPIEFDKSNGDGDGDAHEDDLDLIISDDEDKPGGDLPDLNEVIKAKERDPMMFVSGFDGDEDGIVPSDKPDHPGERLLQASEDGRVDDVKKLILEEGSSLLTYQDDDGYTALHRACYEDHLEVATVLISEGAEVDLASHGGWTPLHSAAHWNAFRCVRLLLENGANINAKTNGGLTPLHVACGNSNTRTRETLLILLNEPGIDLDMQSSVGETAFDLAKRNGQSYYLFEMFRKSIRKI